MLAVARLYRTSGRRLSEPAPERVGRLAARATLATKARARAVAAAAPVQAVGGRWRRRRRRRGRRRRGRRQRRRRRFRQLGHAAVHALVARHLGWATVSRLVAGRAAGAAGAAEAVTGPVSSATPPEAVLSWQRAEACSPKGEGARARGETASSSLLAGAADPSDECGGGKHAWPQHLAKGKCRDSWC